MNPIVLRLGMNMDNQGKLARCGPESPLRQLGDGVTS